MAKAAHSEFHFLASATVRDVVIGMSDGLTVPFALAAGLTGATVGSGVIVTAGLAEIAAGAVAMGLGGYLAARTDAEHYRAEYRRELRETEETPDEERREVRLILTEQGLDRQMADTVVEALARDPIAGSTS
jgi:VIT1/CCC1 family predicted Fe2+/Mn2+ transporter